MSLRNNLSDRWALTRRWLAILATLLIAGAPLAFLHVNRTAFALPQVAINFSWLAILAGFTSVAGAFVLLRRLIVGRTTRRVVLALFAVINAIATALVAVAYVGSKFSNKAWGDNLTFQIVVEVARHPFSSLDLIGTPADSKPLIVGGLALAIMLFLGLLAALHAFILTELGRLSRHDGKRFGLGDAIGLGLFTFAVVAGGMCLNIGLTKPDRLAGEPLMSFVGLSSTSNLMTYDSERVLAALQDRESDVSYRVPEAFERKNVVLIFSDGVRADRLEAYGYGRSTTPFLSSLYASGKIAKVEMAVSPCSESFCGIAAALASRYYHQLSDENLKLNTLLKKAGYRISYILSGDHRGWPFLWSFYGKDIDKLINVSSMDDRELISEFAEAEFSNNTPHFMFFFLMSTHVLGKKFPEFEHYMPANFDLALVWKLLSQKPIAFDSHGVALYPPLEQKDLEALSNRYDNGLLQTDAMIHDIFSSLDRKGLLKNSIVIIVADHGESLGEHGHVVHARFLYQKDVRIPLLIYDDDLSRYQNREFATLVDIAPTIVDRLGLPVPKSWQGVPLSRPSGQRTVLHQTRWREKPCAGVIKKGDGLLKKYIRCRWEGRSDSEEVFDLVADPDELVNIVATTPSVELSGFRSQTTPRLKRIVLSGQGR